MTKSPEHAPDVRDYEADPFETGVDIAFSNLNEEPRLIATRTIPQLSRALEGLQDGDPWTAINAGYEITPTRAILASSIVTLRDPEELRFRTEKPFASAIHQAWASGIKGAAKRWRSPKDAAFDVATLLIMPERLHSLRRLGHLSFEFGDVPAVVFADQRDTDGKLVDFNNLGVEHVQTQLAPEVMLTANPEGPGGSYRSLHDSLQRRGIGGLVIDPHHLLRSAKDDPDYRLDAWGVMQDIEAIGTPVVRVHAAAGRLDSKHEKDRERSRQELVAMIEGPEALGRTAMGELMLAAHSIWKAQHRALDPAALASRPDERLPVTIEVPQASLMELPNPPKSRHDFVTTHRQIAGNLRSFFA